jgi:ADP-ribose pyrophosphatase
MHEKLVKSEEMARGNLLIYRHDTIVDADGEQHMREVVAHRGGVAIVAVTDDHRVLMIRQYRHAVGEALLEIPAGTLDRQPNGSVEEPDLASRRELAEETGYSAREWRNLGVFFTAPGFSTEAMHLYLARGLSLIEDYSGPESDERLELQEVSVDEALRMADAGEIRDAKTLVGLFRLGRLLAAEGQ